MERINYSFIDLLGIAASAACMLHCILSTLAVTLLPVHAAQLWESDTTHITMATLAILFSVGSSIFHFNKSRSRTQALLYASGVLILLFVTFIMPEKFHEQYELYLMTCGSLLLITGHMYTLKKLCC